MLQNLPGTQISILQPRVSSVSPGQDAPPLDGLGLSQTR